MTRPQAVGLPGSMVWWIPDRSTSGRVWPFLRSAPAEQAPRITFRPWYCNCVGRLPGNLVFQGQLLEKRGNVGVEALGLGYFFSKCAWVALDLEPFAQPTILHCLLFIGCQIAWPPQGCVPRGTGAVWEDLSVRVGLRRP